MSTTILADLDMLVGTLADLGDYLRESEHTRDDDFDRRSLETFASDALLVAIRARRSVAG